MSLRIACDLDGVLADLEGAISETALRLFGPAPAPEAGLSRADSSNGSGSSEPARAPAAAAPVSRVPAPADAPDATQDPSPDASSDASTNDSENNSPPRTRRFFRRAGSPSVLGLADFKAPPRPAAISPGPPPVGKPDAAEGSPERSPVENGVVAEESSELSPVAGSPGATAGSSGSSPLEKPGVAGVGLPPMKLPAGQAEAPGAKAVDSNGGRDGGSLSGVDTELAAIEAALVEAVRRPPGVKPDEGDAEMKEGGVQMKAAAGDNGSGAPGVPEGDATAAPAVRRLTERQQSRLWRELREQPNFWENLNEIEPGAVARLAVLAEERRWEVLFITQRPSTAGDTCQLQTHRWLERQGFAHPNVYVIRGSRGRIAASLDIDVVIDDRPENCLDVVVDSKARPILIWRGDAASPVLENARRMGIQVFGSFLECLESLAESTTTPGRFSLVGRLKGMWK